MFKAVLTFALCGASLFSQTFSFPPNGGTGGGSGGGAGGGVSVASAAYTVGTWFVYPGGGAPASSTEASVQGIAVSAGNVSNFGATVSVAPGAGNSLVFTWRKNGADQTVTCTISGASAKTCTDATHSFAVVANDLIDIKMVVAGATFTGVIGMSWSMPGPAGATGPAGPAPAGTGIVKSTSGVAGLAVAGVDYTSPAGTETMTNKTVDGVSPGTMAFVDPTSSIQTQLNTKAPSANPTITGHPTIEGVTSTGATGTGKFVYDTAPTIAGMTVTGTMNAFILTLTGALTTNITGLTQCLHVNSSGIVSGTGVDCGAGGGGGGGVADPGANGLMKRTALNVTAAATPGTDYEIPTNKDVNGGYVGRASDGSAVIPGGVDTSAGGTLPLLLRGLHVAASAVTAPATNNSIFFYDSANSDHASRKDSLNVVHDLEAAGGGGGSSGWIAAPTPTFSPVAGTYTSTQNVTVTCAAGTPYYSTDGATVVAYSAPISISVTTALLGRCFNTGYDPGVVASGSYTITVAAYSGPGDITAAIAFWGLRAYSLAKIGVRIANICNAADANCADIVSLSNGNFDVATANASPLFCSSTGAPCTVKTLYDQTGNMTNCSGSPCDSVQATIANRPALTISGSKAFMTTKSSPTTAIASPAYSLLLEPASLMAVAKRTSGSVETNLLVFGTSFTNMDFGTTGLISLYDGGPPMTATASENTTHSLIGVLDGASSAIIVDGTVTTGTTGGIGGSGAVYLGGGGASDGTLLEAGIWGSSLLSSASALSANQHSYWGF